MINVENQRHTELVQNFDANNLPKNLAEGQALQAINQGPRFDKLELSQEAVSKNPPLKMPSEMKTEKPRAWSISIQALDSNIGHVGNSIKKANSLNLSYHERLTFLREDKENWVQSIKKNNPEMFAEWLKMNQENMAARHSILANKPVEITREDMEKFIDGRNP